MGKLNEHTNNERSCDEWLIRKNECRDAKHKWGIASGGCHCEQCLFGICEFEESGEIFAYPVGSDEENENRDQDY